MKKAILLILQFFLFLGIFLVGSLFWHPFNLRWSVTQINPTTTRYFVPDGLLIMLALGAVILITEVFTKRLRASIFTAIALILALIVGLAAKFGSVTHDLY